MDSALSPSIANIVMEDVENSVIQSLGFELKIYFRYVDDIVLVVPTNKISLIQEQFNYHECLKFTIEIMNNNTLNFLDLNIVRSDNIIILDWKRLHIQKDFISSRFYHFFLTPYPFYQKVEVLYGLIDRAILLSHPKFHHKSICIFINTLLD